MTTFDLRLTAPNDEPVMGSTAEVHTIEHLGRDVSGDVPAVARSRWSTLARMGCRTGFYLLLAGEYESCDVV